MERINSLIGRTQEMDLIACFPCRRLDYFVVSERLVKDVTDCVIRKEVLGSDHCPLVLGLSTSMENSCSGEGTGEDESEGTEESGKEQDVRTEQSQNVGICEMEGKLTVPGSEEVNKSCEGSDT
jgi:hypothetical protein